MTSTNSLDLYRPTLVPLGTNLSAAVFPLMKVFPAHTCITRAIRDGVIGPGSCVVETSSGTMALGLAIVCRWTGCRLTVVTDYGCDEVLKTRLRDLDVRVDVVATPASAGGVQQARLDRVSEICATEDVWWVNQYGNSANPESYSDFAAQIIDTLGPIDCLIGTVGSGGSVCGTARYLRTMCPNLHVVGVDTFGSVLFGEPDRPRKLRGLGNSLMPGNVQHSAFDEIHWVSAAEAYRATRRLHQSTALFRGGTSGACWMVARHWAARHPDAKVLCIFPDDGYRYLHTVYDDAYLQRESLLLDQLPEAPCRVDRPGIADGHWSYVDWRRRSLDQVAWA